MNRPVAQVSMQQASFTGFEGNVITADQWPGEGLCPVLLAPGGGQTRHAWGSTGKRLGQLGYSVTSIDQRGHGGSEWPQSGDYSYSAFAKDFVCVAQQLKSTTGHAPVAIGASLGGIAGLCAQGRNPFALSGLVLVDITPTVKIAGVAKILSFMAATRL